MTTDNNMELYFRGEQLYGDNLSLSEIEQWYADEGEGYANLGAADKATYRYAYHALNQLHGYGKLTLNHDIEILGIGSAYGEELQPVLNRAKHVTIVDPSDAFVRDKIGAVPCKYVKPAVSGKLSFAEKQFDLVTALGVLHHVPNVSAVLREISRVMSPGATMLLREPVVSMGDWRYPRVGLTKHERGLPIDLLRSMIEDAGLVVRHETLCVFPPLSGILRRIFPAIYNSSFFTRIDWLLSLSFRWNLTYHATSKWQKFRPTSVFFVLEKPVLADEKVSVSR